MRMPLLLAVAAATVALGAPGAMAMPAPPDDAGAGSAVQRAPVLDLRGADARDAAIRSADAQPVAGAPTWPTSPTPVGRRPASSSGALAAATPEDGLPWGAVAGAGAVVALMAVAAATTLARRRRLTMR